MSAIQRTATGKNLSPSAAYAMRRRVTGWFVYGFTGICTLISVGLLLYLLLFLVLKGASAISWQFLTSNAPAVGEEGGGILASLTGTGLIVSIATLLGVPTGMLIGIYLAEMAVGNSVFSNMTRLAVNTFT